MVKNVFLIFKNLQNYFQNVCENIERNQIKTTRKFTATALLYLCIRDGGLGLESDPCVQICAILLQSNGNQALVN